MGWGWRRRSARGKDRPTERVGAEMVGIDVSVSIGDSRLWKRCRRGGATSRGFRLVRRQGAHCVEIELQGGDVLVCVFYRGNNRGGTCPLRGETTLLFGTRSLPDVNATPSVAFPPVLASLHHGRVLRRTKAAAQSQRRASHWAHPRTLMPRARGPMALCRSPSGSRSDPPWDYD